jgi:hypothetical protein
MDVDAIGAGLFVVIGESFRSGTQHSRTRGEKNAFPDQMAATESQLKAINFLESKFGIKIAVSLGTYSTPFVDDLVAAFGGRLVGKANIRESNNTADTGLDDFFQTALVNAVPSNTTLEQLYDFVFFCRMDLVLKTEFRTSVDLRSSTIRFPFITWKQLYTYEGYPRVSDTMLFIPSQYFKFLPDVIIGHECWRNLLKTSLTRRDLDVIVSTFHDSDSFKDWNPLYRIANRPESNQWHSFVWIKSHVYSTSIALGKPNLAALALQSKQRGRRFCNAKVTPCLSLELKVQ